MKKLHLVCNAHLDPVWQWEWEEGLAAAISTFRTAAELCEEFDGFIFNHNEALLYVWTEEHEPALFKKIQKLVRQGKWHIMGGWYVQPDCNMPTGESFVRQILLGKTFFQKKFGKFPEIAVNVDSFGHSCGLVQILQQSGYKGYLFMRPESGYLELPDGPFLWQGLHGGMIPAMRFTWGYNSSLGKARERTEKFIEKFGATEKGLLLWGVGNHGGGPSRKDLGDLRDFIRSGTETAVCHSTPEAYFKEALAGKKNLPVKAISFRPFAVGCYTTQSRIKQKHRLLENELFSAEKMCTAAWMKTGMAYPQDVFTAVSRDLALAQFHDILPGSSVQPVEEMAIRLMDHGLEELSRLRLRAFLRLSSGEPKARENEIPVLVYNPHPYPVDAVVECEFMLADQNWSGTFFSATAYRGAKKLPSQIEKENSNIPLDWRKRIAFRATLAPSQMNRFDCRLVELPRKPVPAAMPAGTHLNFSSDVMKVRINRRSGLMESMKVKGREFLGATAFRALVIRDSEDAWGMTVRRFDKVAGQFKLMTPAESAKFSGIKAKTLPAVRIVEDGEVRTVVEALFKYRESSLCLRYKIPRKGSEVEVEARVFWHEKDAMLKLAVPTRKKPVRVLGQTAFGCEELFLNGDENVSQKWLMAVSDKQALTVINDCVYGSSVHGNELRLTLLRSPAYTGHPLPNQEILRQDRFTPRIDQGERLFHFWINAGGTEARMAAVDREALACNEKPMALSFFPPGTGKKQSGAFLEIKGSAIQVSAVKKAEIRKDDFIVRLFEPTGTPRQAVMTLPGFDFSKKIAFKGFEVKTLRFNARTKQDVETNLLEEPL